jgi:hypothetical protein
VFGSGLHPAFESAGFTVSFSVNNLADHVETCCSSPKSRDALQGLLPQGLSAAARPWPVASSSEDELVEELEEELELELSFCFEPSASSVEASLQSGLDGSRM